MMKGIVTSNKKTSLNTSIDIPTPKENEVLVKVQCASVNPTDIEFINGKYDLFLKLLGGFHEVRTGLEFSGIVGKGAGNFKEGDRVFGYVDLMKGMKTHQEYICINTDYIALMPENLNFEQAAALPLGALTTLTALTEVSDVQQGTKLLINGASGGLGVYAVQLAKILGAHTTAIAGPGQKDFLLQLGANEVYNYKETEINELKTKFDVFLDLSNKRRFKEVKPVLADNGQFIPLEPDKHILSFVTNLLSSKKIKYLMVSRGDHQKLTQIARWVEQSKLQVYVDSVYKLSDYEEAFKRLSNQGKQGRVVIKVAQNY